MQGLDLESNCSSQYSLPLRSAPLTVRRSRHLVGIYRTKFYLKKKENYIALFKQRTVQYQ